MRIEIRRGSQRAIIISFDTRSDKFESNYERNKFFRELHGWEQVVPHGQKKYRYYRPGLLNEIPHVKISDSVFMVEEDHTERIKEFFDQWRRKVEYELLQVIVERQKFMKALKTRIQNMENIYMND